jgi:hypothetical protein
MVFLPVSHPATEPGIRTWVSATFSRVAEVFGMLGAAIRVARATEAHRAPHRADLLKLGITGDLPKGW